MSAIGQVVGYIATQVQGWVNKRGRVALRRLRQRSEERVKGWQPALVMSWDAMWTCRRAMRREKWEGCGIWTAVAREADGGRWEGYEVGHRSEGPFLRLSQRLPEAGLYSSDSYWM